MGQTGHVIGDFPNQGIIVDMVPFLHPQSPRSNGWYLDPPPYLVFHLPYTQILVLRNHDSFDGSNWICHWRFPKSGYYRRYGPFSSPPITKPLAAPPTWSSPLSCVSFAIHPILVLRNHDSFDGSNWICHWGFPKSGHYRRYGPFSSSPLPDHRLTPDLSPPYLVFHLLDTHY